MAHWLSGRMLKLRMSGHRFEPHRRHCDASIFILYLFLVQPDKPPDTTFRLKKNVEKDVKNQLDQSTICQLKMGSPKGCLYQTATRKGIHDGTSSN